MTVAFILGIGTAGEVHPVVTETIAGGAVLLGDLSADGKIDMDDVAIAIALSKGERTPTAKELAADPNQDFVITLEDVQSILENIKIVE